MKRTAATLLVCLAAGTFVTGACSRSGPEPEVAAVVEGTNIPSAQTDELVAGHEKAELAQAGGDISGFDSDRRRTITDFVLLYQIKHALLRHLAAGMHITVTAEEGTTLTPDAEAGRLSQAMAEQLFRDVPDEQRQSLFLDWFDQQLRTAKVRVDGHFGHWDAGRGIVR